MGALNKVLIIGNLGRDPESRMAGNSPVCNFSVAVTEKFKNKEGQPQEKTEWVNVVCWNNTATLAGQYLKKGSSVYIEGKIQTTSWDDAQSGQKRYKTEVNAMNIQFLSGFDDKKESAFADSNTPNDDDLPY